MVLALLWILASLSARFRYGNEGVNLPDWKGNESFSGQ
jgi:hypothetical protein